MRDKLVMKYQYPDDVETAMDQFAADNPNAGWREVVREFEKAMLTSMKGLDRDPRAVVELTKLMVHRK